MLFNFSMFGWSKFSQGKHSLIMRKMTSLVEVRKHVSQVASTVIVASPPSNTLHLYPTGYIPTILQNSWKNDFPIGSMENMYHKWHLH